MLKKLGFAVLLAGLSAAASAGENFRHRTPTWEGGWRRVVAPEFDLGSAGAGLALALGGLVVLRARRMRNPQ
jgi:hypothetical protein